MSRKTLLVLSLLVTLLSSAADAQHMVKAPPGNTGVFVGIETFEPGGPGRLPYSVNDAIELAHLFVLELEWIPPENCSLLLSNLPRRDSRADQLHRKLVEAGMPWDSNLNLPRKSSIKNAIRNAAAISRDPHNKIVCSITSHGFLDRDAYIYPYDGSVDPDYRTEDALRTKDIERYLEKSRARCLLFLNACQTDVHNQQNPRPIAMSFQGERIYRSPLENDYAFRIGAAVPGIYKVLSCEPGQESYQSEKLGHSVFTWCLLRAIRHGRPDDDGNITLKTVYDQVVDNAKQWCMTHDNKFQQTPVAIPPQGVSLSNFRFPKSLDTIELRKFLEDQNHDSELVREAISILDNYSSSNPTHRQVAAAAKKFRLGDYDDLHVFEYVLARYIKSSKTPDPPEVESISPKEMEEAIDNLPSVSVQVPDHVPEEIKRATRSFLYNEIGMKLTLIPEGSFVMGTDPQDFETRRQAERERRHRVTLTDSFYISTTEVTQGQWTAVMGTEPWRAKPNVRKGKNYPATYVSWHDAMRFCERLSELHGQRYTLPTEAQWEHACRAGNDARYFYGDDCSRLNEYAWIRENTVDAGQVYPHEVGRKRSNYFELDDMYGNVSEWCRDWLANYPESATTDPTGPRYGSERIARGGSFGRHISVCNSSSRQFAPPDFKSHEVGFRVCLLK